MAFEEQEPDVIDYSHMAAMLHPGCEQVMMAFRQPDGTTKLPVPFPLPLPDIPAKHDVSVDAGNIRVKLAADLGFLNGVCFMTAVITSQGPATKLSVKPDDGGI